MSFLGQKAFPMCPGSPMAFCAWNSHLHPSCASLSNIQALQPPFCPTPLVQQSKDPDSTQLTLLIKS